MYKAARYIVIIFMALCHTYSIAQQSKIDSLNDVIRKGGNDTIIAMAYVGLTEIYYTTNPDSVIPISNKVVTFIDKVIRNVSEKERRTLLLYKAAAISNAGIVYYGRGELDKGMDHLHRALKIQQEIDAKLEVANTLNNMGAIYFSQGQNEIALDYFLQGFETQKKLGDEKRMAYTLNNIANIYGGLGQMDKALDYHYQGLKINEKLNNKSATASSLNNLAAIYVRLGQKDKGLEFYDRSLAIRKEIGDKLGIVISLNNIGTVYKDMGQTEKALDFCNRSLEIAEEITNKNGIANALNNIGTIYDSKGDIDLALEYITRGLKIYEEINDQPKVTNSLNNIGRILMLKKKYPDAKDRIRKALDIAQKGNNIEGIRNSFLFLAKADSAMGNLADAFEHYKSYIVFRDSLVNDASRKMAIRKQMQYEYGKKEELMKAEQAKERAIAEEKNRKQKIITWAVLGGLVLVALFATIIFRSLRVTRRQKQLIEIKNKETELQKKIIEEKNKDILDSIMYAKRIQQAKLPKKEDIYSIFPESFVMFRPKDIVSGDFYFFHKANGHACIAAADCTGHGVPGALMSMIGSEKLNDAVAQSSHPSDILKKLNIGVKTSLRQSGNDDSTRDGMDIALCKIDLQNCRLHYAGANRPLWIVRKGQVQVEEIKATKKAIGGLTADDQHFDSHEIQLTKGDTFYIFSDGYADLFNGINGKKLTTKKLKQLLLDIQGKSMQQQEVHLEEFARAWSHNTEQVDDILVIGVRV